MAGNYPDVPNHRFAYDVDGTQGFLVNLSSGTSVQLTNAQMRALCDESMSSPVSAATSALAGILFYFSEPRNINGVFHVVQSAGGFQSWSGHRVDTSVDTTNGIDGTWVQRLAPYSTAHTNVPGQYRSNITTISATGVRGIRFVQQAGIYGNENYGIHLYGEIPLTSNPNRLVIWHPTLDQPIGGAYFDWGDAPRASSDDRTFRVKNLSPTLTATDTIIGFDALTDTTPSVPGMHLVSGDGSTFTATYTIPSLAPSAISPVLTVRRVIPSNATLSTWALRMSAAASAWA